MTAKTPSIPAVSVTYAQDGSSIRSNVLGMRPMAERAFDDRLIAVDEFHHVSANQDSRLGDHVRQLMARNKTHLVAMTGSYFRGDAEAVLHPDDESNFDTVTYTYYEQLNGNVARNTSSRGIVPRTPICGPNLNESSNGRGWNRGQTFPESAGESRNGTDGGISVHSSSAHSAHNASACSSTSLVASACKSGG